MNLSNSEFVNSLYTHVLLRAADSAGLQYFQSRLDTGLATRSQVVESFLNSSEIMGAPTQLAGVYHAALGRQPDSGGIQFWNAILNSGGGLSQIAQQMIGSPEFKQKYPAATSVEGVIGQIYTNALGRSADKEGLAYWADMVNNKGKSLGDVVVSIALSNEGKTLNDASMKKVLAWHAVVGGEPTSEQLASLPSEHGALAVSLVQQQGTAQMVNSHWESLGTIYSNVALTNAPLNIDLVKDSLTLVSTNQILASGSLSAAFAANVSELTLADGVKVDAAKTPYVVTFLGDDFGNVFIGSGLGDKITGGKGNDDISLGSGKDLVVFSASATDNGNDTIRAFSLGTDLLNFSQFLNKTTANVTMVSANAEQPMQKNWLSGDLLVVQGTNLLMPSDISALFGTGKVFNSPQGASKSVLISANVTGDANVWYLSNASDTGNITANEVQQVAKLMGVNNLLDQDTLNSLLASTQVSSSTADPNTAVTMQEVNGTLFVSGVLPADLSINIATNKITSGGSLTYLQSGVLANASIIDLSNIAIGKSLPVISVVGASAAETMITGLAGATLRGAGGVDSYSLGSGIHKIQFEASANSNGIDVISGFKLGATGDILDFSAFLNSTNKANITTKLSTSTTAAAWSNGQVLVVQGNAIDTASDVAALFGLGKVFAAPTAQAKAVVVTSDIVGDSKIWYVTNQTTAGIASIDASEVQQVAVLQGINNLSLVGFSAINFA